MKLSLEKIKFVKNIKNLSITKLLILLFLMYLVFIFFNRHKTLFIFVFLLVLASISRTYNHFIFIPQLGFELYSVSTVLTGLLLGPWYGLLQGMLSQFFAYFFSGKIKYYTYLGIVGWGLIGFICGLLQTSNIPLFTLGVGFVILYDLITAPIFIFSGARITSCIFHDVTHALISMFVFRTIAPLLYSILR